MAERQDHHVTNPLYILGLGARAGAAASVPGFAVGAFYGTLKTTTPRLFSVISGLQWFAIGSTYWTVRSSLLDQVGLRNWFNSTRGVPLLPQAEPYTSSDKVKISAISGAITGAALGPVFRSARNIIPGTIMFTLFGSVGQVGYNWLEKLNIKARERKLQDEAEGKEKLNWLQRVARRSWTPMSILTDAQYESLLNEKLLSVDAEIAIINDKIKELRNQQKEIEKPESQKNLESEKK